MDKVRTAVVGMGVGRPNGRALSKDPRGRVVALCDLVEERMEQFAEELPEKPRFFTDYREMCQDPEIDAVFVGTPNQWHVPIALEAVKNGKHVMVTKPLADSEEAARELAKRDQKNEAKEGKAGDPAADDGKKKKTGRRAPATPRLRAVQKDQRAKKPEEMAEIYLLIKSRRK